MVRRPTEGFSLVSGSVLMVAVVEGVLEALLSVLDGADDDERDDAEATLSKGEADVPLEDSEEAAPNKEVLLVELPLKTDPEEEVGTLEVAREKLLAADGVMEEEPPKEDSLATFPNAEAPGGRAGEPPKMEEVPAAAEGLSWLLSKLEPGIALACSWVAELLEVRSLAGVAILPLVIRGAGELVFDLPNAVKGELLAVSAFDPKIEESGVDDLEEASSLLMISTISGVADFAFSSTFGVPKLSVVEGVRPPNAPTELLIGVTEKPPSEDDEVPKPSPGLAEAGLDAGTGG